MNSGHYGQWNVMDSGRYELWPLWAVDVMGCGRYEQWMKCTVYVITGGPANDRVELPCSGVCNYQMRMTGLLRMPLQYKITITK